MLAKFSYISVALVPERTNMVSVAFLEYYAQSNVCFLCLWSRDSAWYTMFRMLQFPSSGQVFLLRQLHVYVYVHIHIHKLNISKNDQIIR